MTAPDSAALDWAKGDGLLPAVVQHADSGVLLMVGFMNPDALARTLESRQVTFWSRSKGRLWTKGETSGHALDLVAVHADCDADTLLVFARPRGPVCHRGTATCFASDATPSLAFLDELDALVARRACERPPGSYTTSLIESGLRRIAQKVGEEGVEAALAGVGDDDDAVIAESADLMFHLIVLLRARGLSLAQVVQRLRERHGNATS